MRKGRSHGRKTELLASSPPPLCVCGGSFGIDRSEIKHTGWNRYTIFAKTSPNPCWELKLCPEIPRKLDLDIIPPYSCHITSTQVPWGKVPSPWNRPSGSWFFLSSIFCFESYKIWGYLFEINVSNFCLYLHPPTRPHGQALIKFFFFFFAFWFFFSPLSRYKYISLLLVRLW